MAMFFFIECVSSKKERKMDEKRQETSSDDESRELSLDDDDNERISKKPSFNAVSV